ncbi:MAG TPA: RNA polymerase sigma factor SigJ [Propionibacteriaceae bacterium]|nr:RNA polymerase sigma factor SigJ [Propionibacteriaceae bacterium]
MTSGTAETEIFEQHRRQVTGVAYRITGSWTDAEDIAQDVWLRWAKVHQDVDRPRNWLLRVTVRASLDRLRRLKRRRETYLGPWLPEPVSLAPDPEDTAELRDTLMVGMLLVLESLSPLERAVFVLREAFAWDYEDIAEALGRSPAAVRQLARRAHQHVEQARPRFAVDERRAAESTERFLRACLDGNVDDLLRVLSPDVVMYTDGGGEAPAPKRALVGAHEVLSFFAGLGRKNVFADSTFGISYLNTHPGIITSTHGQVMSAMTFDYDPSGRIVAIYVTSAPSKLAHVSATAAAGPGNGR